MRRRRFLAVVGTGAVGTTAGCADRAESTPRAFVTSSPAFESGGTFPTRFTCVGDGISPPIAIDRVPEPTESLAVTAEYDRGVINEPRFWSLWNVPPLTEEIPAGVPRTPTVEALGGARQGRQRGGEVGYEPPCPPSGQPYEHRFTVYALGEQLSVEAGTEHDEATEAIGSAVLASARITVSFTKPSTESDGDA